MVFSIGFRVILVNLLLNWPLWQLLDGSILRFARWARFARSRAALVLLSDFEANGLF